MVDSHYFRLYEKSAKTPKNHQIFIFSNPDEYFSINIAYCASNSAKTKFISHFLQEIEVSDFDLKNQPKRLKRFAREIRRKLREIHS